MKSTYALPLVTCLSLGLLAACQSAPLGPSAGLPPQASVTTGVSPAVPAMVKTPATGEVRYDGQTLTVQLQLPPLRVEPELPFQTQLLDLTPAAKITATVKDSYGKSYTPVGADGNGQIVYPANGEITLSFNNVLPDELLLVEAQVTEASPSALIPQADLAVALRHTAISDVTTSAMDFQSTAVAKTLKALLALNAARARAVSLPDLNSLMQTITGRSGSAPNYTYAQNHPSLVKISALATALQAQEPATLTASASSYRGVGATVNLSVSGLLASDTLQVQLTDAATGILSALGNGSGTGFSLAGATPGSGLSIKVLPFGTPSKTYTYSVSPSTLPPLTEGGSQNVTITAVPEQGVIFVKANATGSNNGTNWANAYTDLQTALAAASSGDEIWIAEGTYKPHASDPNVSFVMKDGIKLYGGFAGNESTLAARNFVTHKVILSGDIDNNDDMSGDYLANYSGNTKELIGFAGRSYTLDGVTLQGANGNAMSMGAQGSPIVKNVIFRYNFSSFGGAAIYFATSNATLENLVFEHNLASGTEFLSGQGGAIHVASPGDLRLNNAIFYKNRAQTIGSPDYHGMGGAISTFAVGSGSVTLTNVAFAQNSASHTAGALYMVRDVTLRNVTLADNTSGIAGDGLRISAAIARDLKNVLLWKAPVIGTMTGTEDGNITLPDASTPFTAAANPAGPDGVYFTADDGLQLNYSATAAINTGINDEATIPERDILGRSRVVNHESGAYEYIATDPPTLSGFSPDSGTAGTSVTITGTNFSDTSAVRFNGVDAASFTVDSPTQITATVPATAVDGPVSVLTTGGVATSSGNFDVYRVIYVKANASGGKNGSSWANAFTDLQLAIAAAYSGDEIWIAAGTYKPHASDPNVPFVMKDGIKLYGGFAGNESTWAARNFVTNKVILSGDIDNNDDMTGDYLVNYSGNTKELIGYAGRSYTLDGVTLQGANGNAMSMGSQGSPVVRNVIFRYNFSSFGGPAIYLDTGAATFENLVFEHNLALGTVVGAGRGGAIFLTDNGNLTLTNAIFFKNRAEGNRGEGGALYLSVYGAKATFTNVAFAGNSASQRGGAIHLSLYPLILRNVTLAGNSASDGSIFSAINTAVNGKNVLFWSSSLSGTSLTGTENGNITLPDASTPFVDAANPAGPDGVYFTADDGLNLNSSATDAFNAGINDEATIPERDVLNRARLGGAHEPGAYEYGY